MKFDLENLNPGVFFPFEDSEGGITIRLASGEALNDIDKKCVKKKVEYRKGQRYEVVNVNDEKRSTLLWDYVIVDWEGVTDLEGNPIPCTQENKHRLMIGSTRFSNFVSKCVENLAEDIEEIEEELEKN